MHHLGLHEFIERVRQPAPEDFVADDSEMRELLSRAEALLETSVNCTSDTSTDGRVHPKVTEAEPVRLPVMIMVSAPLPPMIWPALRSPLMLTRACSS